MHSRSNTTRFGKATIAMFAAFVLFTFHQIASADDSPSATKWHPWIDFAGFAGTDGQSRGEVGLFVPLVQNPDSMLFGDLRVRLFENDIREGNFAIGYRTMLDNGWNAGAWMGFDVRETSFNNVFRQVSGGLEYLHHDWGFRLNGYVPLDGKKRINSTSLATTTTMGAGGGGAPNLQLLGNQLFLVTPGGTTTTTMTSASLSELPLYGVDAEFEYRVPLEEIFDGENGVDSEGFRNELRLIAGGFYFDRKGLRGELAGPRARAEWRINDVLPSVPGSRLSFEVQYQYDAVRESQLEAGVRLTIPIGVGSDNTTFASLTPQERRMSEALVRDTNIVTDTVEDRTSTSSTQTTIGMQEPVNDAATNVALDRTIFVPGGTDLSAAIAGGGQNSHIVAQNGAPFDGQYALLTNQTLQGGGSDLPVVGRTSGTMAIYTAPGATPTLQNSTATRAGGPVLEINTNTHVVGIIVQGVGQSSDQAGNIGILASGGTSNTVIDQTRVFDTGGPGIQFGMNTNGALLRDVQVQDSGLAGIDILNSTGTFTFANVDISNTDGPAVNTFGGDANVNFDTASSVNQMRTGAAANVAGGHTGTLNFDGMTNATNGTGLQFDNAEGTYNFNGMVTLNGGDAGIDILNSSGGTFTFADTSINNPTGIAFNIAIIQDAAISITGPIIQNNTATAVRIDNFTNSMVAFNGPVTANTGAATGIDLTDNMGSTIGFGSDLDIDTTTGTGFSAMGGGTITVGGPAITSTIDTTNGQALRLDGVNMNITFTSILSNNSPTEGVDIDNVAGTFMLTDGDDDNDTIDILTINGTGAGFAGIDIANSPGATFTFANVDISNTGSHGVHLDNAGTAFFSARSAAVGDEIGTTFINSTNGDGFNITNTNTVITFARIGEVGQILGDGIEINNTDGVDRTADIIFNNVFGLGAPDPTGRGIFINAQSGTLTAQLNANFTATEQSGIQTRDGGTAGNLILDLTGNSTLTTFGAFPTMDITGSGLNSTIVRSWDFPNQVIGGITNSSGILFDRVTFDADGDPSNGFQQVAFDGGDLDIGQVPPFTIQRVEGNGLTLINPTGNLSIGVLNIANQNGTGLLVDTSGLGTTFNLDIGGGTIDTVGGAGIIANNGAGTLGLNLNNAAVNATGNTIELTNSTVSGVGNTALGFACISGGGNTGQIAFNGGVDTCP